LKALLFFLFLTALSQPELRKYTQVKAEICLQDPKRRNQPDKGSNIEHRLISDLSVDPESHVFLRLYMALDMERYWTESITELDHAMQWSSTFFVKSPPYRYFS